MTFTTLITDEKTFASKFEAEFKKLFKAAPAALAIVSGVLTYAGPLVSTLVGLAAGAPAGGATALLVPAIQKDIAVLSTAITAGDASVDAPSLLASIQASLPALLSAAKVENVSTVSLIEGVVAKLVPEIDAVLKAI